MYSKINFTQYYIDKQIIYAYAYINFAFKSQSQMVSRAFR